MKKFMVIYHMPDELMAWTGGSTPEEREKGMQEWMVWAEKCGDKLVDFGTPLMGGKKLSQNGNNQDSTRLNLELAGRIDSINYSDNDESFTHNQLIFYSENIYCFEEMFYTVQYEWSQ